jgi:hypothetical protein
MKWIGVGVFLAGPLILSIVAVALLRGGYRILACLPCLVLALAYALDLVSVVNRGNLAGLFTMIAAGPCLGMLAVVLVAKLTAWLVKLARRRRDGTTRDDGSQG